MKTKFRPSIIFVARKTDLLVKGMFTSCFRSDKLLPLSVDAAVEQYAQISNANTRMT